MWRSDTAESRSELQERLAHIHIWSESWLLKVTIQSNVALHTTTNEERVLFRICLYCEKPLLMYIFFSKNMYPVISIYSILPEECPCQHIKQKVSSKNNESMELVPNFEDYLSLFVHNFFFFRLGSLSACNLAQGRRFGWEIDWVKLDQIQSCTLSCRAELKMMLEI